MSKPKYVLREINDLKDMLEQTVALHSENEAFIKKSKDVYVGVSYKKYKEDVFSLGTEFIKRNVKGEKLIILSENRYEWCVSFMATVCGGGVAVPINPKTSEDDLISRINLLKGKFIVFSEKYREIVRIIRKKCPTLEYTIDMDTIIEDDENLSLLRLMEIGNKAIQNGENDFAKIELDKDMIAAIFYGDTIVKSKGVMLSHKNLVTSIMGLCSFLPITKEYKSSAFSSFSELSECISSFLALNNQGGTVCFSEKSKTILENLKDNNPTILFLTEDFFNRLSNEVWGNIGEMPNVRKVKILMAFCTFLIKFNIDLRKNLFKDILKNFGKDLNSIVLISNNGRYKKLKEFYVWGFNTFQCCSVLEASGFAIFNDKKEVIKDNIIGLPLPGVKAKIINSSNKITGEIALEGDSIMMGYYDDKKATNKVIQDNLLHTGKRGYRDKNGYFYLVDKVNKKH